MRGLWVKIRGSVWLEVYVALEIHPAASRELLLSRWKQGGTTVKLGGREIFRKIFLKNLKNIPKYLEKYSKTNYSCF